MSDNNWKATTLLAGGVLGLVTGIAAAYMYVRTAEENNTEKMPARVEPADAFKLGLAAVALVRQIADLAVRPAEPKRR
jgi:hypothetical protein